MLKPRKHQGIDPSLFDWDMLAATVGFGLVFTSFARQAKHDLATPDWTWYLLPKEAGSARWEIATESAAKNWSWNVARGGTGRYSILANRMYLQVFINMCGRPAALTSLPTWNTSCWETSPQIPRIFRAWWATRGQSVARKTASLNFPPLTVSVSIWWPQSQHFCYLKLKLAAQQDRGAAFVKTCQDPNFEICHNAFSLSWCHLEKSIKVHWQNGEMSLWQVNLGLLWLIKPHVRLRCVMYCPLVI